MCWRSSFSVGVAHTDEQLTVGSINVDKEVCSRFVEQQRASQHDNERAFWMRSERGETVATKDCESRDLLPEKSKVRLRWERWEGAELRVVGARARVCVRRG